MRNREGPGEYPVDSKKSAEKEGATEPEHLFSG
jgi:hypothetical protein